MRRPDQVESTHLVTSIGESCVPFGQHALHAQEERPLALVILVGGRALGGHGRRQHRDHFVVVSRMDVLVDAITGEFYLERKKKGGRPKNKHLIEIGSTRL